jgi:tetratricopeptide (TPR) repeat protein
VIETLELEVKLWEDDKERAGVFAQIGRVYGQELGDAERAMQYYESALTVDPECLPANQAVFEHFFDQGAWDKAQPIATSLAQKAMRDGDPTTRSDFYRKRGVVARMTGDPRAAAESFIVALEIRPVNGDALDALGALARERPDVWDFDATYRELEKVYKKREDAGPLRARPRRARGDPRARRRSRSSRAALSPGARPRARRLHRAVRARHVPRRHAALAPGARRDQAVRRGPRRLAGGSDLGADAAGRDPRRR